MKRRDLVRGLVIGGVSGFVGGGNPNAVGEVSGERKRSVRFVHFTDVHVHPKRSAPEGLAKAIRHVHALSDRPDFVLNGGDAIGDALEVGRDEVEMQWGLWKDAWKENGG
ncbi:MAG: hypothetical protein KDA68_09500, partial [Planctomycetaceae bacterium]|nr:hypothetical protein [Planctomycetaceae bacterium]